MRDTRHEILHFWFEETDPRLWFVRSDEFDSRIKKDYASTYEMAKDGLCNNWTGDADGCLALCIVLDQFPRRLFRGTAQEFETDDRSLLVAKQAVAKNFDKLLNPSKRFFLYIPFERSEKLSDHKRNLELFKSMEKDNPVAYHVALRRFAVIEKFGRYPERNKALDRESTPEEKANL
ncbi:MAG: DUF924 family protein, partial [Alphaproteobacteria bacterium]